MNSVFISHPFRFPQVLPGPLGSPGPQGAPWVPGQVSAQNLPAWPPGAGGNVDETSGFRGKKWDAILRSPMKFDDGNGWWKSIKWVINGWNEMGYRWQWTMLNLMEISINGWYMACLFNVRPQKKSQHTKTPHLTGKARISGKLGLSPSPSSIHIIRGDTPR